MDTKLTEHMDQPDHELPAHTVGVFVTYRRAEPLSSREWAEKTGLAFRHAPFVIAAVTAAAIEPDSGIHMISAGNTVLNEFISNRRKRVELLKAWPELHGMLEVLGGKAINDVVALQLSDPDPLPPPMASS